MSNDEITYDRTVRYTREKINAAAEALGFPRNEVSRVVMEPDSIEVTFRPTREEMANGITGVTVKALRV